MPIETNNDNQTAATRPRQHPAAPLAGTSRDWPRLLALKPADQPWAASALLLVSLAFGGWYLWRATTTPGLVELEHSEPTVSKLVVNVNTAEAAELMLLPEVGKTTAAKIVEERLANGPFRSATEFGLRIKGIGPKTLPKVTPFLEGWTEEPRQK
jgi:DNA uptake protein ComE-like DNA-binding protein